MQYSDLEVGQRVSFELYPSHIYGSTFNNVTITAFLDHGLANALGFDVIAAHQMVYPSLPEGSINDPTQYNYVRIQNTNGEYQIIGIPWIRESTINISNGKVLTLIFQDINETRKDRIIAAVKAINETPDGINFKA